MDVGTALDITLGSSSHWRRQNTRPRTVAARSREAPGPLIGSPGLSLSRLQTTDAGTGCCCCCCVTSCKLDSCRRTTSEPWLLQNSSGLSEDRASSSSALARNRVDPHACRLGRSSVTGPVHPLRDAYIVGSIDDLNAGELAARRCCFLVCLPPSCFTPLSSVCPVNWCRLLCW